MLMLKALEGSSRSFEATIVYHLLLSSVKTFSIFEKQLIKLPAREESFRKPTSLCAMGRVTWTLRKRAGLQIAHVQNHMPTTLLTVQKFLSRLNQRKCDMSTSISQKWGTFQSRATKYCWVSSMWACTLWLLLILSLVDSEVRSYNCLQYV